MMPHLQHQIRREQTESELDRLDEDILHWLAHRKAADRDEKNVYLGFHKTRLQTLETVLTEAVTQLRARLMAIDITPAPPSGAVYDAFRRLDKAIVWLRRVWEYYQEKFDQRDKNEEQQFLLQAADEMIWSCYRQVITKIEARTGQKQGPPPLAYLAPEYSPAAWESDKASPAQLLPTAAVPGLESFLRSLPVPVLRLPPWCRNAPWWLIYIPHEVGHHIQHQLNLIEPFRKRVRRIAVGHHLPKGLVDYWSLWSEEIFADSFSIMMVGSWAVRAIWEVEWSTPAAMMQRRRDYPPAIVRLRLMEALAEALQLIEPEILSGCPLSLPDNAAEDAEIETYLAMIPELVTAVRQSFGGRTGKLEDLCGVTAVQKNSTDQIRGIPYWSASLQEKQSSPTRTLLLPRVITCATLSAWAHINTHISEQTQRVEALTQLARHSRNTLRVSGPLGDRAGRVAAETVAGRGTELGWMLYDAVQKAALTETG